MRLAIPSRWCAPGFGLLIGLALFALRAAELTADSLNETRAIATGGLPLHPHHLLFAPIVRALHLALAAVVPGCDALVVAQVHGALWTGISVASAYWILEHELGSRRAAALWALALAVSSGYLTFATQVESYVPSAGCLLLLSALLLRARGPWTAPAAIVLYAAAVLFHQSAVLFAVPLFFLVRRTRGASPASSWLGTYALVLAASGALVLTAYVLASGARSLGGVLDFALTYAHHPNAKFGSSSHLSPIGVFRLLRSQERNLVHVPGLYSIATYWAVGAFSLVLAGLVFLALRRSVRGRAERGALLVPSAWLAVHWAFFLWFLPGESDHFVQTVFPLLWFAALVLDAAVRRPGLRRAGMLAAVVLVVGCAAWNVARVALPRHRDRGPSYREVAALARQGLVEQSLVLTDYELGIHATHYFGARSYASPPLLLQHLYLHGDLPPNAPSISQAVRVIVPLRFVDPAYRVGPHSGSTHARGWLDFLRWLCDLDRGDGLRPPTHAALRIVTTDDGGHYLVLDPGERVAGDLPALLGELDTLVGPPQSVFLAAGAGLLSQEGQ